MDIRERQQLWNRISELNNRISKINEEIEQIKKEIESGGNSGGSSGGSNDNYLQKEDILLNGDVTDDIMINYNGNPNIEGQRHNIFIGGRSLSWNPTDIYNNIVIGVSSNTQKYNNIAIGYNAICSAQNALSIGHSCVSTYNGTSIGHNIDMSGNHSIAIGRNIKSIEENVILIGSANADHPYLPTINKAQLGKMIFELMEQHWISQTR
jgi:hypothetical protein